MSIASQYVRGAKVPAAAQVTVLERIQEYVQVTIPAVLPPVISGVMSLTAGFPNPAISEVAEASNTPTASETISESASVSNTPLASESINESVSVTVT